MPPKNNTQDIKKYTHVEHVLKIPDTYIGSTELTQEDLWVFKEEQNKMVKESLTFCPGEYKIFDEIMVNALDQYVRINQKIKAGEKELLPVKNIKVSFNLEENYISVQNDGEGISVEKHPSEDIHIPELIFGHLLTSGNYDKKDKVTGGKNGYGGKLANIFSTHFILETVDHWNQKKYVQHFRDNMSVAETPIITSCKTKPYTKITYYPDFIKFNQKSGKLTPDIIKLITKRTYDAAAITGSGVNVYLNDSKLECKSFEKYVDLYLEEDSPRLYQEVNDRWSICVAINPLQQFDQVSFVNGITTYQGGKHVEYISNQVTKKLSEYILKKKKIQVKTSYIKENLFVFIRCLVSDPSFNSQVKEFLTTPISKFGSKCELDDKFIDKIAKLGLMDLAINLSAFKENKDLKKTDGKKKTTLRGIPKLDDANFAGGPKSHECTLILTEGDSAKSLAISGLSIIGRDKYGVFPLKGKVLNVKGDDKNMSKKILENAEITNLKKIIGLQADKKYKDTSELRYGSVMLLTDQDEDGSHIKGLLFNLFQTLWPELFRMEYFTKSMLTPLVKVTNNKSKKVTSFYNVSDYESWKDENNNGKGFNIKYYKGLGTSTPKEAKDYFRDLRIVNYVFEQEKSDHAIELAFNKKLADSRKEWLATYDRNCVLDYTDMNVSHSDFIDKDLKHFSNSDNRRSIPSMIDGLKVSQRKIMYCAFKKKLHSEIRVAQFSGYVSENGGYHHGEASLQGAIVNMAQDFIGSNNINLLEPIGQFGSRIMGGSDSAQPRYIHTKIPEIINHVFPHMDNNVLEYINDDGLIVEPIHYVPIIPMILVNGSEGIGTGWSTFVPSHNPLEIIANITKLLKYVKQKPFTRETLDEVTLEELQPWYRGFTGEIVKRDKQSFLTYGKYEVANSSQIHITELPIRSWTDKYKEFLETLLVESGKDKKKSQCLRNYTSQSTDSLVKFTLTMTQDTLEDLTHSEQKNSDGQNKVEKTFKLTSKVNTSNMVLYNAEGFLKKYKDANEILKDYFMVRHQLYIKRKVYQLQALEKELLVLNARVRFILEFISGKIVIANKSKKNLLEQLLKGNYPNLNHADIQGLQAEEILTDSGYDYLIKMPIYNLTKERIEELNKEKDQKSEMFNTLQETAEEAIWLDELKKLAVEYQKFLKVKIANMEDSEKPKRKVLKKKK